MSLPGFPSRTDPNVRAGLDAFFTAFQQWSVDFDAVVQGAASLLAQINSQGTWTAKSYSVGQGVYYNGTFYSCIVAATSGDVPGVATTKWAAFVWPLKKLYDQVSLSGNAVVDFSLPAGYVKFDLIVDGGSFSAQLVPAIAFSTNGTTFGAPNNLNNGASIPAASTFNTPATIYRPAIGVGTIISPYQGGVFATQDASIVGAVKCRIGPISAGVFSGAWDAGTCTIIGYRG